MKYDVGFKKYVSKFDERDYNIERKINHSYRVAGICHNLATKLGLSEELVDISYFIGLMHDIGRFRQYTLYKVYDDTTGVDHALLGIQILFDEGFINEFDIDSKWYTCIKDAIYNHNKYSIDKSAMGINRVMSNIIRDSDKLDILMLLATQGIKVGEDGKSISSKVDRDFRDKKLIDVRDVVSKSDMILMYIANMFDLVYIDLIDTSKVIENLRKFWDILEYKDIYRMYFEIVYEYLEKV